MPVPPQGVVGGRRWTCATTGYMLPRYVYNFFLFKDYFLLHGVLDSDDSDSSSYGEILCTLFFVCVFFLYLFNFVSINSLLFLLFSNCWLLAFNLCTIVAFFHLINLLVLWHFSCIEFYVNFHWIFSLSTDFCEYFLLFFSTFERCCWHIHTYTYFLALEITEIPQTHTHWVLLLC